MKAFFKLFYDSRIMYIYKKAHREKARDGDGRNWKIFIMKAIHEQGRKKKKERIYHDITPRSK